MTTRKHAVVVAALCATLSPAMATSTATAPPFLDVLAYAYGQCVQPAYHQADLLFHDGPGSYQLAVKGETYTVALQERMGFSLQAGIDGPVVAVVSWIARLRRNSRSRRSGASGGCATWPSVAAWRSKSGRRRAVRVC